VLDGFQYVRCGIKDELEGIHCVITNSICVSVEICNVVHSE
jgi:hypothetical protein